MRPLIQLSITLILGFASIAFAAPNTDPQQTFVQTMVAKGYNAKEIQQTLAKAKYLPEIIKAMERPAESLPWYQYQQRLISAKRIRQGVAFYKKNQATLVRAQKTYNVPAEIIVAILGIETSYGQNTGRYRVLDALSTLAFHYPPRAQFFQQELIALFKVASKTHMPIEKFKGSYAGAIGPGQFMPSSLLNYAVDFSHDKKVNSHKDMQDAIGSIANYLHKNGWQFNTPIVQSIELPKNQQSLAQGRWFKLTHHVDDLKALKISLPKSYPAKTRLGFIELEKKDKKPQYYAAFNNFHVITTYNRSVLYAMAVTELAEQIAAKTHKG